MKTGTFFALVAAVIPLAAASPLTNPLLLERGACQTPQGSGTCVSTSSCSGFHVAGYCPGAADIQCCISKQCSTGSGSGTCRNKNTAGTCSGTFVAGACPGDSNVQCCVAKGSSPPSSPAPAPAPAPPATGGSGGSGGQAVVNAAEAEKGLPYVYGGGGTSGPTKGGFDCSGLSQYSVFKATGKTIPRTADTQYQSGAGKHIPRAQAQAGDLIFWATGGNCKSAVEHVGIFMKPGLMINAATTGTPVREQSIWTSSGGLEICPDAVRFW